MNYLLILKCTLIHYCWPACWSLIVVRSVTRKWVYIDSYWKHVVSCCNYQPISPKYSLIVAVCRGPWKVVLFHVPHDKFFLYNWMSAIKFLINLLRKISVKKCLKPCVFNCLVHFFETLMCRWNYKKNFIIWWTV